MVLNEKLKRTGIAAFALATVSTIASMAAHGSVKDVIFPLNEKPAAAVVAEGVGAGYLVGAFGNHDVSATGGSANISFAIVSNIQERALSDPRMTEIDIEAMKRSEAYGAKSDLSLEDIDKLAQSWIAENASLLDMMRSLHAVMKSNMVEQGKAFRFIGELTAGLLGPQGSSAEALQRYSFTNIGFKEDVARRIADHAQRYVDYRLNLAPDVAQIKGQHVEPIEKAKLGLIDAGATPEQAESVIGQLLITEHEPGWQERMAVVEANIGESLGEPGKRAFAQAQKAVREYAGELRITRSKAQVNKRTAFENIPVPQFDAPSFSGKDILSALKGGIIPGDERNAPQVKPWIKIDLGANNPTQDIDRGDGTVLKTDGRIEIQSLDRSIEIKPSGTMPMPSFETPEDVEAAIRNMQEKYGQNGFAEVMQYAADRAGLGAPVKTAGLFGIFGKKDHAAVWDEQAERIAADVIGNRAFGRARGDHIAMGEMAADEADIADFDPDALAEIEADEASVADEGPQGL